MMALEVDRKEKFREVMKSKNMQDLMTSLYSTWRAKDTGHYTAMVLWGRSLKVLLAEGRILSQDSLWRQLKNNRVSISTLQNMSNQFFFFTDRGKVDKKQSALTVFSSFWESQFNYHVETSETYINW